LKVIACISNKTKRFEARGRSEIGAKHCDLIQVKTKRKGIVKNLHDYDCEHHSNCKSFDAHKLLVHKPLVHKNPKSNQNICCKRVRNQKP
jgi:DUF2075 family protein